MKGRRGEKEETDEIERKNETVITYLLNDTDREKERERIKQPVTEKKRKM